MLKDNFETFCNNCFLLIKYLYLYSFNLKTKDMIAANFSEFRTNLKNYLDNVEDNNETLIVKRKTGKGTVMISLDEYNSIMETVHLLSSKANADNLYESIRQMKNGEKVTKSLIEE
jgi:antitoxin YefM